MEQDAIARFMQEAASLVAEGGPNAATFAGIAEGLRRLGDQPRSLDDGSLGGLHASSASAAIIGEHGDGSVLMLARFPAGAPTPVHNHNSWGVVFVARGRDRYERWERTDDGSDPTHADVRLAEETILEAGDAVWFEGPPRDLHAQQGIVDEVWELVYFGRNPNVSPRAYFDPATGVVTYESAVR
jgi:predicted metal-dependent enzyme (double-stranded beta helix superfamily)